MNPVIPKVHQFALLIIVGASGKVLANNWKHSCCRTGDTVHSAVVIETIEVEDQEGEGVAIIVVF